MRFRVSDASVLLLFLPALCVGACVVHVRSSGPADGAAVTATGPATTNRAQPVPPAAAPTGAPTSDAEVCAVREAIVAALRASAEPWASGLADRTEGAPCALAGGSPTIGQWSMNPCEGECATLRFLWREPGAQVPAHAAEVVRDVRQVGEDGADPPGGR